MGTFKNSLWSTSNRNSEQTIYRVTEIRKSESALIFFAEQQDDLQHKVVLKILRKYADKRYQLVNIEERLKCQCEALRCNYEVNPNVYKGLAPVLAPNLDVIEALVAQGYQDQLTITLGCTHKSISDSESWIEPDKDYALVMSRLPEEQRLDVLLNNYQQVEHMEILLEMLVKKVINMHAQLDSLSGGKENWGSYKQIKAKLVHNITHFELIAKFDASLYEEYRWIKIALRRFIKQPKLKEAFRLRKEASSIKRCHGDLKTRNIWIEAGDNCVPTQSVRVLDAIDFNPSYCDIDVLSDLAMLAIDIQGISMYLRKQNNESNCGYRFAEFVTRNYLLMTQQKDDETAKIALSYYLVEKAVVLAIMSLVYDRVECSHLGPHFLKIAFERMKELDIQLGTSIVKDHYPKPDNVWFNGFLVAPIARAANRVVASRPFLRFNF